ncbi:MAG: hypothetical protein U9Q22_07415 [Candidatus Altiarchaeota archaeon]|nr:hypothetical protein [Candidatus Altiarchaeota archaeon]
MKKEIPAGLIAIVVIVSIAIFVVTPSMSTSFEIDGKLTSDELELLFLGSGDDEYQEYKYDSYKIEKSRISASAGGAEVYEAGWLPEFLEKWIDKLFEFLSGTDPKELGEDLYEKVDEEYPHYDEAGEPGPPPVAGEATGEYAGPMQLIIDGKLSEDEQSMLDAMGVGEIVFGRGRSTHDVAGDIVPGVKSARLAFLEEGLYFYEESYPLMTKARPDLLGYICFTPSKGEYPLISCNINNGCGCLIKTEKELRDGIDLLDSSRKFKIRGKRSGNETEYVVEGLSCELIEEYLGREIKIRTLGGAVNLGTGEIKKVDVEVT